jgi:ankyrin repeat protein
LVVELGADINLDLSGRYVSGHTPLIEAASKGNLAIVRCLTEHEARIGMVASSGDFTSHRSRVLATVIIRQRNSWLKRQIIEVKLSGTA